MARIFACVGAAFGFLSVAAGAFGAHTLKGRLAPEMLEIFEKAARYQMYHSLALLAVAWAATQFPHRLVALSGWMFIAGTILFSGSLYVLVATGAKTWGAVTPIGGVLLLAGWATLALGVGLNRS
ncbi:MAG: DUF423 domain-containing protein [Nitrospirae bacterium]|nr:DUF423 domain-containing protein [Nitrospirota bacterium]